MMSLKLTNGEYFEYNSALELRDYLNYLFYIQENNRSEWNRTDNIVGIQPQMESSIKEKYTKHIRNQNVVPVVEYVFNANTFLK